MCGIAGVFQSDRSKIDTEMLRRMNDSLAHRGPDDSGYHIDNGIGLAHRRLSIIDLSTGKQPIYNENKSVVVVFNGEIYNFRELRSDLKKLGHRFRTLTDTEVIVHAWEEWGEKCVKHLRGMFAFALWDLPQETLFLARDRLGIKPLYYSVLQENSFVFASELKAIRLHKAFRPDINPHAVEEYFAYGYVPDPRTIYSGVKKLPPGHTLRVTRNLSDISPTMYWDVPFKICNKYSSENEVAKELLERLREAVNIRLISDVPLGAFLSGGVDSSAIVSLMAELQPDQITTCSIAFEHEEFNESSYSTEVAGQYRTDHHVRQVKVDDFALVNKLAHIYDEPYADSSALPTYRLCEMAREWVTVALSGDGGDENFAGYRDHLMHYNKDRIRRVIPTLFRRFLFGSLGRVYPRLYRAPQYLRARTTFESLALDAVESFARGRMITTPEDRHALFSSRFKSNLQGYDAKEVMCVHAENAPTQHPLSLAQYLDMKVYLPGDILTKVDRASMAHSLEVRVPMLDHLFVEWVSSLPPDLKLRAGISKYILKKAYQSRLSEQILFRPKMGFSIPLSSWLRGPLRNRLKRCVFESRLLETGIFDQETLQTFVLEHLSRRRDHGPLLWALIMFDNFLNVES
ncbi:XrtA/PEP-CTERM system amidotransferase [Bythopirellula goksoeyrii]|uniref:asparagine synthase (glutamine-hydrolyzing) n=1 Tax=Bythopirellula goksoeyrii TaxID=1400387 RepID=A0A5B9QAU7_9BACT|nr:XrtA/PEP-CTERM system amidotransferase [Bythopirellula goksoeyrii]QEG36038.1 Asparagine synthetase [glutamine-hydrolyzing] 1 [Bythopirellula goksoeyrii]